MSSTPRGTLRALPRERSSSTTTSQPAARYASAMCEPMKPAPPAISTRPLISCRCLLTCGKGPVESARPSRRVGRRQYRRAGCGGNRVRGSKVERVEGRESREGRRTGSGNARGPRVGSLGPLDPRPPTLEPRLRRPARDLPGLGTMLDVGRRDGYDARGRASLADADDLQQRHHLGNVRGAVPATRRGAPDLEDVTGGDAVPAALVEEEYVLRPDERLRERPSEHAGLHAIGNRR